MNKLLFITIAAAALAACGQSDSTDLPDANAAEVNTADIVLPPSILASKVYRCKDNSVLYIDWLSDGSARAKADKNARATPVMVGENEPLTGSSTDAAVTYNGQRCSA